MSKFWKSKTDFYAINRSQTLRSSGCNSIALKNLGSGKMIINNAFEIEEGGTFINSMPHPDVADVTEYRILFENPAAGKAVALISYVTGIDANGSDSKSVKDFCVPY